MKREDKIKYEKQIAKLDEIEEINAIKQKLRNIHLRSIAKGETFGPPTYYPDLDKPWLKYYSEENLMVDVLDVIPYDYMAIMNADNFDSKAIYYMGTEITYMEMLVNIRMCAKAFASLGVKEGDIVTFCTPTTPETIYMFYALNYLGAIANFVDLRTNKERIAEYIDKADSKIVVANDNVLKKVNGCVSGKTIINSSTAISLPAVKKQLYTIKKYKDNRCKSDAIISYNDFIKQGENVEELIKTEYSPDKIAAIVYTGGTTGVPKGAKITYKAMNSVVTSYRNSAFKRETGDKFIDIMPPFIAYGLMAGIHLPLCCGFEDMIYPLLNPKDLGGIMLEHKPAHFIGVPTHFDYIMNDPRLDGADLSFIKNYGLGGDSLNPNKEEEINKFLKEHNSQTLLRVGYGMTENSAPTVTNVSNECTKISSVGVFLLGNNAKVVDPETGEEITNQKLINPETGKQLPYSQSGEIYITGNQIMGGYFKNDEETKKVIVKDENGRQWIKTGDYGYIDDDGNLFIKGRLKKVIIRPDGHNVYPNYVAAVISKYDIIQNVCVVGLESIYNYNGTIPTAYVILKDKSLATEETKQWILQKQLENFPERDGVLDVRFVDEFPLTPVGKIDVDRIVREETRLSDIDFDTLSKTKSNAENKLDGNKVKKKTR